VLLALTGPDVTKKTKKKKLPRLHHFGCLTRPPTLSYWMQLCMWGGTPDIVPAFGVWQNLDFGIVTFSLFKTHACTNCDSIFFISRSVVLVRVWFTAAAVCDQLPSRLWPDYTDSRYGLFSVLFSRFACFFWTCWHYDDMPQVQTWRKSLVFTVSVVSCICVG